MPTLMICLFLINYGCILTKLLCRNKKCIYWNFTSRIIFPNFTRIKMKYSIYRSVYMSIRSENSMEKSNDMLNWLTLRSWNQILRGQTCWCARQPPVARRPARKLMSNDSDSSHIVGMLIGKAKKIQLLTFTTRTVQNIIMYTSEEISSKETWMWASRGNLSNEFNNVMEMI